MSTNSNNNTVVEEAPTAATAVAAAVASTEPSSTSTAASSNTTTTTTPFPPPAAHLDPLLRERSNFVRRGDYVLLNFADGRQFFVQCVDRSSTAAASKTKHGTLKFNKRTYPSYNLIGLPYGTILEVGRKTLQVLDHSQDLLPAVPNTNTTSSTKDNNIDDSTFPTATAVADADADADCIMTDVDGAAAAAAAVAAVAPPLAPSQEQERDNRHLIDDNTSQGLDFATLLQMRKDGKAGSEIVQCIIENSATFESKTDFSKAKYIARKQIKYQPRCRLTRCTAATISVALYAKDAKKVMNMRDDSLGQMLAYANIYAGSRVLVFETASQGLVTGAVAERMGGYGSVFSIYTGQQPAFLELLDRFNLSFGEASSIKWVHCGDVFDDNNNNNNKNNNGDNNKGDNTTTTGEHGKNTAAPLEEAKDDGDDDAEAADRNLLEWPCPLQDHTRQYLLGPEFQQSEKKQRDFIKRRCARFARKLTRHSPTEAAQWLRGGGTARKCDSVIIATRYNPTETLLGLLPFLAPSCPFVVFCEYLEPLTACFKELQNQELAINLRLSDTWMREWQILPGRTHPNMNMSQSGGFILTGIKLDEHYGRGGNHFDEALLKEIRLEMGPRRGKKKKNMDNKNKDDNTKANNNNKNKKSRKATAAAAASSSDGASSSPPLAEPEPKRSRTEDSHSNS